MKIRVSVDIRAVESSIKRVQASMRDRKLLFDRVGGALQKYVVETIRTQGRGTWQPLAPSTKRLTGRKKALITLIPYIKTRSGVNGVTVYFSKRPKDWSLEQHQSGYTSSAVSGKLMKVKPSGRKAIFFSSRKAVRVPARRVFPGAQEAVTISMPIVDNWVKDIINRKWRGR